MYLIEFEESEHISGTTRQLKTTVRLAKHTGGQLQVLAETVYDGAPPGLSFQDGQSFAMLRLLGRGE